MGFQGEGQQIAHWAFSSTDPRRPAVLETPGSADWVKWRGSDPSKGESQQRAAAPQRRPMHYELGALPRKQITAVRLGLEVCVGQYNSVRAQSALRTVNQSGLAS